eukprot:m.137828 g.137828  ORF g.137828 m.137828 type:complete len:50 (-) comp16062_c0_seq2:6003-6152(-)
MLKPTQGHGKNTKTYKQITKQAFTVLLTLCNHSHASISLPSFILSKSKA